MDEENRQMEVSPEAAQENALLREAASAVAEPEETLEHTEAPVTEEPIPEGTRPTDTEVAPIAAEEQETAAEPEETASSDIPGETETEATDNPGAGDFPDSADTEEPGSTGEAGGELPAEAEEKPAAPDHIPIPILTVEKSPELEPITVEPAPYHIQYGRSAERERKIAAEVRRRKRRPILFVLILSTLVVVAALITSAVQNHEKTQFENIGEHMVEIVTPDPGAPAAPTATPEVTEAPVEEAPKEHTYRAYREDVTWTVAAEKCRQLGGYLVVIDSQEEYESVVALALDYGIQDLWIGCHRVDNDLVWEAETEGEYFYHWDDGEPSLFDSGDGATENYIMLWNHNGWTYNDSRNDLMEEYAEGYSGKIGYICEFEG